MLRFQVESVKDFKGSTWLTLMEGLEQPWTIKLLEKATEPATFAISKKVTNKVLSSHSYSLFIKKLGTLERDTLICKFLAPTCSMQVHENPVPCFPVPLHISWMDCHAKSSAAAVWIACKVCLSKSSHLCGKVVNGLPRSFVDELRCFNMIPFDTQTHVWFV